MTIFASGEEVDQTVGYRVPVTLSEADVLLARSHAHKVQAGKRRNRWQDKWPQEDEKFLEMDARAFGGEIAVARLTGLPWHPVVFEHGYRGVKPRDVGTRVEVRTARRDFGGLWGRRGDRDEWVYVLATGSLPFYVVHGWIEGRDFRVPKNWRETTDGRPSNYFLSQVELHKMPLPEDA